MTNKIWEMIDSADSLEKVREIEHIIRDTNLDDDEILDMSATLDYLKQELK